MGMIENSNPISLLSYLNKIPYSSLKGKSLINLGDFGPLFEKTPPPHTICTWRFQPIQKPIYAFYKAFYYAFKNVNCSFHSTQCTLASFSLHHLNKSYFLSQTHL